MIRMKYNDFTYHYPQFFQNNFLFIKSNIIIYPLLHHPQISKKILNNPNINKT